MVHLAHLLYRYLRLSKAFSSLCELAMIKITGLIFDKTDDVCFCTFIKTSCLFDKNYRNTHLMIFHYQPRGKIRYYFKLSSLFFNLNGVFYTSIANSNIQSIIICNTMIFYCYDIVPHQEHTTKSCILSCLSDKLALPLGLYTKEQCCV